MSYKILNILKDGRQFDITPLVSDFRWGGDIKEAARYLEVTLIYSNDYYLQRYDVPLGSILILYSDNKELIRTVVFTVNKSTDEKLSIKGYDHLIYLLKSQATNIFTNMSADKIATKICNDFGIQIGYIAQTGIPLNKVYRDMSLYDQIVSAYTDTSTSNGKKYQVRMIEGRLQVTEKGSQTVKWKIEDEVNLSSASYSESIEDMKNKIVITGEKDKVLAVVQDDELIELYGILQDHREYTNATAGEVNTYAKNLLNDNGRVKQEASINCLGIDEVETGVAVELYNDLLGLSGVFYVDSDDHIVQNDIHSMSLRLKLTDDVAKKYVLNRHSKKKSKGSIILDWNL